MKKISVLGAGNMGSYIASNLSKDHNVTLFDFNAEVLEKIQNTNIQNKNMTTQQANLSDMDQLESVVQNFDFVVSALPEAFGYEAIERIIHAGKNVVDISFWKQTEERINDLNKVAKKNEVQSFIDCGIAPGFSNLITGYFDLLLEGRTQSANIYVGGIPSDRNRRFFAPWSITGLIEEYQREALCIRDGRIITVPALSESESLDFPGVGKLEASITDGLRSIAFNMKHVPNMAEFTLRYPGYFEDMRKLRDLGFYDDVKKYSCDHGKISPRDVAVSVLAKEWEMRPEDRDILVMRIQADDGNIEYAADIYAKHDGTNSAMALTTGGMAALGSRAIMEGFFKNKGVFTLENAIKIEPSLMIYFVSRLQNLGVTYAQKRSDMG